jgi:sarcosine oxidase subunit beta
MGQDLSLRRCGYLFLLDNSADLQRFRANVALQNRHGVPSRIVSPSEIALLAPEVNLDGVVGGSWCALDGLVDPHGLLQGYITRARALGVALLNNAPVTALEADDGRLHRVVTPRGTINTRMAVVAAGPWSAQIGALAGISIPIQPIRRQIAVTRPAVRVRDDFPFVIDFSRALYFHREGDGILTGMSNRDEEPGFDTRVDEEWQSHHLESAMARMPFLADAELVTQWAGLYEVTPDDQPIIGRLPGVEGLFICAGFSGHGLMHGPAAGLLMAEEIMDEQAHTIDISPLRWQRFADNAAVGEYNVV